jgi:hypothetical protein
MEDDADVVSSCRLIANRAAFLMESAFANQSKTAALGYHCNLAMELPMTRVIALAVAAALSFAGASAASAHSKHKRHYKHGHYSATMKGNTMGGRTMSTRNVNNPTPTRNDPPGTRTQCRGGCTQ